MERTVLKKMEPGADVTIYWLTNSLHLLITRTICTWHAVSIGQSESTLGTNRMDYKGVSVRYYANYVSKYTGKKLFCKYVSAVNSRSTGKNNTT